MVIEPKHKGRLVFADFDIDDVEELIDWSAFEDEQRARALIHEIKKGRNLTLQGVVAIERAKRSGDDIIVTTTKRREVKLPLANREVVSMVASKGDYICCYALSAGVGLDKISDEISSEYEQIATRLCNAFVERIHSFVRRQMWGYEQGDALSVGDILSHNFHGTRFEVGSMELPNLSIRGDIFSLMGVEMTTYMKLDEDYNITPKGSVCGIILSKSVKVKKETE